MVKLRLPVRLAAGCLVALGGASAATAAPTVQQMLAFKPKMDGVQVTTPSEADQANCKVDLQKGTGNASAWVLKDGRGNVLRRFADTKGNKTIDIWSYYSDGVEVYREIDTNANGKPDNFRWLGSAGMRWGVDLNEDGTIDGWKQISAEEVSQEVLKAVVTRNVARLQALTISEAELRAMELPATDTARLREASAKIPAEFAKTCQKMANVTEAAKWIHLETAAPQCVPAEQTGGKYDLLRYKSGTILYELGGKHDWLQTGEMVQVGRAWRIVTAPVPGHAVDDPTSTGGESTGVASLSEELKPLIDKLTAHDKNSPKSADAAETVKYNLGRAAILEEIASRVKPAEAEQWVKQVADCYSAAAQNSGKDPAAYKRLVELRDRIVKAMPGTALAGYVVYREMSADYASKVAGSSGKEMEKVQDGWRDSLKKFVGDYPTAEDAPDAVMQLGMVSEFVNKDTEAKNWYEMLAKNYGKSPLAAKASGALKRLSSTGKVMELSAPTLGASNPFDIAKLGGKVVVVYYWASWNSQCAADFFKLKTLANTYGSKGMEIVCVNLDNNPTDAIGYLQKTPTPGTHIHQQPSGLDGTLATQYGVMVLPNMFLVGKDGKVVSSTVQMSGLEDEVKKLIDK